MFKYAPGMESGLGAALNMMRKHAEPDGDEGTTVTNIFNMEDKESGMNDIAGLMALMQNNKGMDLPGILALCQQKGYGREGGGWGRRHGSARHPVVLPHVQQRWLGQQWQQGLC